MFTLLARRSRSHRPSTAAAEQQFRLGPTTTAAGHSAANRPRDPRTPIRSAMLAALVLILTAFGMTVLTPSAEAAATRLCTGYASCNSMGYSDAGYSAVSSTRYWGMEPGHNCTNYAAYRLIKNGVDASYLQGQGMAWQWGGVAKSRGITVNSVPAVGAIAWWGANSNGAGSTGHVAYVEAVTSDGILISEDNYGGNFHWVKLTPGGYYPTGFIHFKDMPTFAEGSFVRAADNGRIYRIAGGAPLWLSSCVDGCTGLVNTTQAIINGLRPVPTDGKFLRAAETGRVYRVVGGAPIWLSSCVDGCPGLVNVNQWTIDVLDHLRAVPANGSFLRAAETGRVYRVVGGAPIWLSSCVDGCPGLVKVNQWSVDVLDHLRPYPADGSFLRAAETGRVYRAAGGAPMWLSSCVDGCPGLVNVNQWSVDVLDHLRPHPADGTLLRAVETGRVYMVNAGSPTWLSQCPAQGCVGLVNVNQWTIDIRDHLRP
jgi:surface antigen